jgi:hypothetical protein
VLRQHVDDDPGQAGLDQRIGIARRLREVLAVGDSPAEEGVRADLVQHERTDAGERHPSGNAGGKQTVPEFGQHLEADCGDAQDEQQDRRQRAHAPLFAV